MHTLTVGECDIARWEIYFHFKLSISGLFLGCIDNFQAISLFLVSVL